MSNFLLVIVLVVLVCFFLLKDKKEQTIHSPTSFLLRKALQLNILSSDQVNALFQIEEEELINKWLKQKQITLQQAESLRASIRPAILKTVEIWIKKKIQTVSVQQTDMHRLIMGISAFAAGCVLLGLIALIAANWDIIPSLVKLICFFVLFSGALFVLCHARQKQNVGLSEIFLGICIGLTGAGIGLVGQIYHLSGSFWSGFFLWIILSTPYFLFSRLEKAPVLWSVLYALGAVLGGASETNVLWILLILPVVLKYATEKLMAITWWISFCAVCLRADWFQDSVNWLWQHVMPVPAFFFIGSFLLFFWLLCRRFLSEKAAFTTVFKNSLILYFTLGILGIDFAYTQNDISFSLEKSLISACFALSGVALPLLFLYQIGKEKGQNCLYFLYAGLALSLIYAFMTFSFAGVLLTVFILLGGCIYGVRQNKMRLFNLCLALMFVRVLWAYIDLFMSLMSTGISLILLGIAVWLGLLFWIKGRQKLIALIQRSLPHV